MQQHHSMQHFTRRAAYVLDEQFPEFGAPDIVSIRFIQDIIFKPVHPMSSSGKFYSMTLDALKLPALQIPGTDDVGNNHTEV